MYIKLFFYQYANIVLMNEDKIDDLKQFIQATVSQSEMRLEEKINNLENKMSDGFAGVADALEDINAHVEDRHSVVDQRLTILEAKVN